MLLANEKTISFTNNLTKFAGRHEFRGGYTLFRSKLDHWQPERQNPRGSIVIATNATRMRNITGQTSANFYNQYAAMMFGLVRDMGKSIQNEVFSVYEWTHGMFVRDRWNVSQKLTLDLGLRYEIYPVLRRATRGMSRRIARGITSTSISGGRLARPVSAILSSMCNLLPRHTQCRRLPFIAVRFGASVPPSRRWRM